LFNRVALFHSVYIILVFSLFGTTCYHYHYHCCCCWLRNGLGRWHNRPTYFLPCPVAAL